MVSGCHYASSGSRPPPRHILAIPETSTWPWAEPSTTTSICFLPGLVSYSLHLLVPGRSSLVPDVFSRRLGFLLAGRGSCLRVRPLALNPLTSGSSVETTLPFHHWNFCTSFFYVRVLLSSVFLTQVTVFLLGAMDIHCAVFSDKIQHSKATLKKPILVQGPEDLLTFTATFRQTSPLNVRAHH